MEVGGADAADGAGGGLPPPPAGAVGGGSHEALWEQQGQQGSGQEGTTPDPMAQAKTEAIQQHPHGLPGEGAPAMDAAGAGGGCPADSSSPISPPELGGVDGIGAGPSDMHAVEERGEGVDEDWDEGEYMEEGGEGDGDDVAEAQAAAEAAGDGPLAVDTGSGSGGDDDVAAAHDADSEGVFFSPAAADDDDDAYAAAAQGAAVGANAGGDAADVHEGTAGLQHPHHLQQQEEEAALQEAADAPATAYQHPHHLQHQEATDQVSKLNELEALLRQPDAVMEPDILLRLREYVVAQGNPKQAVEHLTDSYVGERRGGVGWGWGGGVQLRQACW